MAGISSIELKQILEINAKAVEVYLEVSSQYEAMIKILEELKINDGMNERNIEKILDKVTALQETFDEIITEYEKNKDKHKEEFTSLSEAHDQMFTAIKDKFGKVDSSIVTFQQQTIAAINNVDRSMFRLTVLLGSSAVLALVGVVIKLFGP